MIVRTATLADAPGIATVHVRSWQAAYRDLSSKGVKFTRAPYVPKEALGIVGTACCYDPNGNIVEMIELEPGVRHSRATEALKART